MKSFKQFRLLREENEEQNIEQGVMDKSGVPSVVVLTPSDETRQLQQQKQDADLTEDLNGWGSVEPAHTDVEPAKGDMSFQKWQFHNHNPYLGAKIADVHKALSVPVTKHEEEHLHRYSQSSNTLNNRLYEGHLDGEAVPRHYNTKNPDVQGVHDVKALDKATSVPLTHELHVHTGVRFHPGQVAAQHPEGHVHLPAYTSTSISPSIAHSFSGNEAGEDHVLHIHLKPGDRGRYIAPISRFPHEKEFTLPRHTTLKIHPQPDTMKDGAGVKINVWHAHVVHQKDLTKDHE